MHRHINAPFDERTLQFGCKQTLATRARISRQDRVIALRADNFDFNFGAMFSPQSFRYDVRLNQSQCTSARPDDDLLSRDVTARIFSAHTAPLQRFSAVIKMPVIPKG